MPRFIVDRAVYEAVVVEAENEDEAFEKAVDMPREEWEVHQTDYDITQD